MTCCDLLAMTLVTPIFLAASMCLGPAAEQKSVCLPQYVLHSISGWLNNPFSKKFSSIEAIVYLVTVFSHCGVVLLTYFFIDFSSNFRYDKLYS